MRKLFHAIAALAVLISPAVAQESVESFYRGRTMNLIVGYGTGGGYDVYARHIARHFGRFLPGHPTVVVQNMPGAGSLVAANHLYNAAPKDGSAVGMFAREMPMSAIMKANPNIRFDPMQFTWIGSPAGAADDVYLMFARKDGRVKDIRDIAKPDGPELVLGGTGTGSGGNDWALLLRDGLGLRIKLIPGYRDSNALFIAVERGEIDGRSLDYSAVRSSRPDWLKSSSDVHVVLQFGIQDRHRDFPNAPTARELARTPAHVALLDLAELSNTLARPFVAPPGVPQDRAAAMRTAFTDMTADKDYLAEAEKLRIEIAPLSAATIMETLRKLASAPPDVLEQLRKIRSASGQN